MSICHEPGKHGCHIYAICKNDTIFLTSDQLRSGYKPLYKTPNNISNAAQHLARFHVNLLKGNNIPSVLLLTLIDEVVACRVANQERFTANINNRLRRLQEELQGIQAERNRLNAIRKMQKNGVPNNEIRKKHGNIPSISARRRQLNVQKKLALNKFAKHNKPEKYASHESEIVFWRWLYRVLSTYT